MKILAIIITAHKIDSRLVDTLNILKNQRIPKNWKINIYIGVDGCELSASILNKHNINYYFSKENVGTYTLFNSVMLEAKKMATMLYSGLTGMMSRSIIFYITV